MAANQDQIKQFDLIFHVTETGYLSSLMARAGHVSFRQSQGLGSPVEAAAKTGAP